ncbi:hypothetical protein CFC21_104850 [Triticum aestivum]|uniref:Uncharacterized protein n=3 Tax=Triticum TaxID=4564 RepID=A0A9R1AAI5_TRITD|nr:hypothetical protein CFC21_104850 [Triticum aestivum]VAI92161.1 unnamed protein product [Triticum turgidum subsp. durum]
MGDGQRREPGRRWGAEAPTIHPHLRRASLDLVAADRPYSSDASVGASPLPRSGSETLTQRPAREKQRMEEERSPWRKAGDDSRNLLGELLVSLGIKEPKLLEKQLDSSSRQYYAVRCRVP